MASIEKRITSNGEVHYRAKVRLKGYPQQSETFRRKTDAQKWVQQTEAAIREGRHFKVSESKKRTLSEAIQRYIDTVLPQKPRSYDKQKSQLEYWDNLIGAYLLSDITPALVAEQRDKLANEKTKRQTKRSPSTVNRYLAVLSHLFTIALKEWSWVNDNPLNKVSKLKEPRGRVRYLSDDEREALLSECKKSKNPYLYTIVILGIATGARRSEILNLRWEDVDLKRGQIVLHDTKNKERRSLPLSDITAELIRKLKPEEHGKREYLFPNRAGNGPYYIRTAWDRAVERAGIEDFKFHDLRHTAASYLAMNGASPLEIADILGHKSPQMTHRYTHLSEPHTAEVVQKMNNKMLKPKRR